MKSVLTCRERRDNKSALYGVDRLVLSRLLHLFLLLRQYVTCSHNKDITSNKEENANLHCDDVSDLRLQDTRQSQEARRHPTLTLTPPLLTIA